MEEMGLKGFAWVKKEHGCDVFGRPKTENGTERVKSWFLIGFCMLVLEATKKKRLEQKQTKTLINSPSRVSFFGVFYGCVFVLQHSHPKQTNIGSSLPLEARTNGLPFFCAEDLPQRPQKNSRIGSSMAAATGLKPAEWSFLGVFCWCFLLVFLDPFFSV